MEMKEGPRGGRRWFAVESKSFELLVDNIGGKLRGCIWERCRGYLLGSDLGMQALVVCWMELRLAVEGVTIEVSPSFGRRGGRKYRLECHSNEAGRFLLCSVHDLEAKRFFLIFLEGKGLIGGWNILAEKLRETRVVPSGGLKDS